MSPHCVYRSVCLERVSQISFPNSSFVKFGFSITDFPSTESCSLLERFFSKYSFWLTAQQMASCRILCRSADPLNLFLYLGASPSVATGMCIFLFALMILAALYLVVMTLRREAQWILTFGSLAMSTGLPFFVVLYSGFSDIAFKSNPTYVIAAMNVATFTYFFSGFQYGVSPGYELLPAILLITSGYPLWIALFLIAEAQTDSSLTSQAWLGFAMAVVSLVWTLHSALYRTIGYRAAWIQAWRLHQSFADSSAARKRRPRMCMRKLWTLAAALEQPTWRTIPGQSTGVALLGFSWIIAIKYDDGCHDIVMNIFLFKLLRFFPPVLMTVATLWNQVIIASFGCSSNAVDDPLQPQVGASSSTVTGRLWSLLRSAWKSLFQQIIHDVPTRADYMDSVTAYKLGRNMLNLKPTVNTYRTSPDIFVGFSIWVTDIALNVLSLPIHCVLVTLRVGFRCIMGIVINFTSGFTMWQSFQHSREDAMKLGACEMLYKNCRRKGLKWSTVEKNMKPCEVDAIAKEVLNNQLRYVNLNELLERTTPAGLEYLLTCLDDDFQRDAEMCRLE